MKEERKIPKKFISVQASPDQVAIRHDEYEGVDHLVVPMVILVEGVLFPSDATFPELALAEEFGRFPQGWDGSPVVLGHPVVRGITVSANSPSVLEDFAFGTLFNTKLIDDKKLISEAWINLNLVANKGEEFQDAVDRLQDLEEMTELSTGLYTQTEIFEGKFDNKPFGAIWRNIVPDHLAILKSGDIGACSVKDGCGAPRMNSIANSLPKCYILDQDNIDKEETAVGEEEANNKTECSCEDPSNCDGSCGTATQEGMFSRLMRKFGKIMSFSTNGITTNSISDVDIRKALWAALERSDINEYFYVIAVFIGENEQSSFFIYEQGFSGLLLQRDFSIKEGGAITLSTETVEVRPETKFVPVKLAVEISNQESQTMGDKTMSDNQITKIEDKVDALISSEGTKLTDNDKAWLNKLSSKQLDKIGPIAVREPSPELDSNKSETTANKTEEAESAPEEAEITAKSEDAKVQTPEEYLKDAPDSIQAVLNEGLKLHKKRKETIVNSLLDNNRNRFTKEQLNSKDIDELEIIASLANVPMYTAANAGAENTTGDRDSDTITEAPDVFPLKAVGD